MSRHGVFLPPFDALADPRLIAELATEAERAGWDGFFVWDHMAYTAPVRAILDPWICLAAVADATERIVLGAMVTPLSRRRPAVLARQAVTLDLLSRGRLVLGFGLGDDGRHGELSRFGEQADPVVRAEMLDEGLGLLQEMLSGSRVEHDGKHYRAAGVEMRPTGYRPEGIPIWIAGRWPNRAPLRRAARFQGAFVISVDSPDQAAALVAGLREQRGTLEDFDVVVELPDGADEAAWSAVPGISWLLTRFGPYHLDEAEVRRRIAAGPPSS